MSSGYSGQDKPADVVRNVHDRVLYENTSTVESDTGTGTIDATEPTAGETRNTAFPSIESDTVSSNVSNNDNTCYNTTASSNSYDYNDSSMSTTASIDITQMVTCSSGIQDSTYY
ncbi:hypothetical protein BGZ83_009432 [Gryganskiella cystojenkinii]|nr:hypothetical protein BGZ83_009432 [Gryganskiella cystojenkinii]